MWEKRPTREGIYVYMYMYTHVYMYTEYIYICIHIADSVHCTAETNTAFIVKQLYCNFKKKTNLDKTGTFPASRGLMVWSDKQT